MSFKSILDKIGSDAKAVFSFLGSSKGKVILAAGETAVEDVFPVATGVITIANTWLNEIFKTQALATAAGASTGSNTQKAAMTIAAVTPEVLAFAEKNGLPVPTGTALQTANDALVTFLNAFSVENTANTTNVTVNSTNVPVANYPITIGATTGAAVPGK